MGRCRASVNEKPRVGQARRACRLHTRPQASCPSREVGTLRRGFPTNWEERALPRQRVRKTKGRAGSPSVPTSYEASSLVPKPRSGNPTARLPYQLGRMGRCRASVCEKPRVGQARRACRLHTRLQASCPKPRSGNPTARLPYQLRRTCAAAPACAKNQG